MLKSEIIVHQKIICNIYLLYHQVLPECHFLGNMLILFKQSGRQWRQ